MTPTAGRSSSGPPSWRERGEEFALATVVWRQGPSSGQQGSRAIVTADGQIYGWIGGACAEPVVIREAQRAIVDGEPRLLLLGDARRSSDTCPTGMAVIPISVPERGGARGLHRAGGLDASPGGRRSLADVAHVARAGPGARAGGPSSSMARNSRRPTVDARAVVVVATQGHGDEEAVEHAVNGSPAYRRPGGVAEARRARCSKYLADRGVPQHLLDRVRVPVGLDLGHTTHSEIAVAILAELVQLRASGALRLRSRRHCSVAARDRGRPGVRHDRHGSRPMRSRSSMTGVTYYFCCCGAFERTRRSPRRRGADQDRLRRGAARRQGVALLRRHPAGRGLPARCRAHRGPRRREVQGQGRGPDGARSSCSSRAQPRSRNVTTPASASSSTRPGRTKRAAGKLRWSSPRGSHRSPAARRSRSTRTCSSRVLPRSTAAG